jgi:hypothetical protein
MGADHLRGLPVEPLLFGGNVQRLREPQRAAITRKGPPRQN